MLFRTLIFAGLILGSIITASNSVVGEPLVIAAEGSATTVLKAQSLNEVVRQLALPGNTRFSVQPEIAGQKATLICPLGKEDAARTKLAELLGYDWNTRDGTKQLAQSTARAQEAQKLRNQRASEARASLERRLLLCGRVLRGDRKALPLLEAMSWRTSSLMSDPHIRKWMEVLRSLNLLDAKRLSQAGYWMSKPLGEVSPEAQAVAAALGPSGVVVSLSPGQEKPTEAQIQEAIAKQQRDVAFRHVMLQLYGNPDDPGVRGGLVNPLPLGDPRSNQNMRAPGPYMVLNPIAPDVLHVGKPLEALDRPGPDTELPELQQRVSLTDPAAGTGTKSYPRRLEDVLERLAASSGLNIVADSYQSNRSNYLDWGKPMVDVPLWRVLRQICYDFNYEAKLQDGWLMFRHARWPYEEENEIPEALLAELDQEVKRDKGLSHQRMLDLAARLSRPQFLNLAQIYRELRRAPLPYSSLRILGTLDRVQRKQAESAEGLPILRFTPDQLRELRVILASQRPYVDQAQLADLRLRLLLSEQTAGIGMSFTFAQGDRLIIGFPSLYPIRGAAPETLPDHYKAASQETLW